MMTTLKLCFSLLHSKITWLPNPYQTHEIKRPPPISTLPAEILIQILKHLYYRGDLYSCVLVSRCWCECAVELLWYNPFFLYYGNKNKITASLLNQNQTFTYPRFIRQLNLEGVITDDFFSIFSRCERLERLTLFDCKHLTGEGLAKVFPHFTNLVAINLRAVVNTTSESIIALANVATRLQDIDLAHCTKVTDDAVLALATSCPLLRKVKLYGLGLLTDDSISSLVLACPMLWELDLSCCKLITDASVRLIWTHLIHMHELRLSHCSLLTDAAFPVPAKPYIQQSAPKFIPTFSTTKKNALSPLVFNWFIEHPSLLLLNLSGCSLISDSAIEGILSHASEKICVFDSDGMRQIYWQ